WKPTAFQPTPADQLRTAAFPLRRNDYETAARLYRPLAERGYAEAQGMLGLLYYSGAGVPLDHAQAVKWLRLAAQQGEAGGQFNLGIAFEQGKGVPRNYVRAYLWYALAAASGDAYADTFAKARDTIAAKMTPQQIAEGKTLAGKCKASNFKGCE